jgi:hypothetical protein
MAESVAGVSAELSETVRRHVLVAGELHRLVVSSKLASPPDVARQAAARPLVATAFVAAESGCSLDVVQMPALTDRVLQLARRVAGRL